MAELEEEALGWKEGFGTNPLKLPQGVRRRGLRLRLRLPPRFRHRWVVSIPSSASTFLRQRGDARRRRPPTASPFLRFEGDGADTEGQRSSIPPLSLSGRADASSLRRQSCCFSPSYFSCHFDSITRDLCWVHNPLK